MRDWLSFIILYTTYLILHAGPAAWRMYSVLYVQILPGRIATLHTYIHTLMAKSFDPALAWTWLDGMLEGWLVGWVECGGYMHVLAS